MVTFRTNVILITIWYEVLDAFHMEPLLTFLTLYILKIRVHWTIAGAHSSPFKRRRIQNCFFLIEVRPCEVSRCSTEIDFAILFFIQNNTFWLDRFEIETNWNFRRKYFSDRHMHLEWVTQFIREILLLQTPIDFNEWELFHWTRNLNYPLQLGDIGFIHCYIIEFDVITNIIVNSFIFDRLIFSG